MFVQFRGLAILLLHVTARMRVTASASVSAVVVLPVCVAVYAIVGPSISSSTGSRDSAPDKLLLVEHLSQDSYLLSTLKCRIVQSADFCKLAINLKERCIKK